MVFQTYSPEIEKIFDINSGIAELFRFLTTRQPHPQKSLMRYPLRSHGLDLLAKQSQALLIGCILNGVFSETELRRLMEVPEVVCDVYEWKAWGDMSPQEREEHAASHISKMASSYYRGEMIDGKVVTQGQKKVAFNWEMQSIAGRLVGGELAPGHDTERVNEIATELGVPQSDVLEKMKTYIESSSKAGPRKVENQQKRILEEAVSGGVVYLFECRKCKTNSQVETVTTKVSNKKKKTQMTCPTCKANGTCTRDHKMWDLSHQVLAEEACQLLRQYECK